MLNRHIRQAAATTVDSIESIALEFDVNLASKGFHLYFDGNNDSYAIDWNDTNSQRSGESVTDGAAGYDDIDVDDFAKGFWYNADAMQSYESNFSGAQQLGNGSNATLLAAANAENVVVMMKMIAMAVVLGLMILITIIGNVFVIAAIILERNLQNVANYLVASLAVADLFVACLVMPLGAVYEISEGWILGAELCDIWTSCDVLCCTASILHLVAIAADRYWTVTDIDYNNLRTPRRVFFMIFCVWLAAVVVSLAPQFGWKDAEYMERIEQQKCMVSQDVAYQIFATCCTFYMPLLVILVLYWKIYKIARKRIQRRAQRNLNNSAGKSGEATTSSSASLRKQKGLKNADRFPASGINLSVGYMREETEFSTSNYESRSHAGTELTNVSSDADELHTPTILDEISTVSQHVASASSLTLATSMSASKLKAHMQQQQQQQQLAQREVIAITLTTPQHPVAFNTATTLTATTSHITSIPIALSVAASSCSSTQHDDDDNNSTSKMANSSSDLPQKDNGKSLNLTSTSKLLASIPNPLQSLAKRRKLLEAKRERKAAQTLAIITGAFAVCWLPFFVMALLLSLCKSCHINPAMASFFLWLGYFNSTLNPIIYTIFNPEFRRAFQRILCGRKHSGHYRSGRM